MILFGHMLFLLLSGLPVHGDDAIRLDSNLPGEPVARLSYTHMGVRHFEGIPGLKASMHEADVAVSCPLIRREDCAITMGFAGIWDQLRFDGWQQDANKRVQNLYVAALSIDLRLDASENLSFSLNVTPAAFTDFDQLTREDFQVVFCGLGVYQASPAVSLALGVAGDREFGDDLIFPVGGMIWNLNRELQVSLLLPWPRLAYAPRPWLAFFCDARPAGNKWSIGGRDGADGELKLEKWRLGAGFEARLMANLWLQIAGGAEAQCFYKIDEEGTSALDAKADDVFFLRAGLLYR